MLSYHNDSAIKEKYLSRVIMHHDADEIIKGTYWENGKGCAVGCTIHGNDHARYETELGIPRLLARLEDGIFEGLPNDRAKIWPREFLEAVQVGVDLSTVWPKFAVWMLTDKEYGVIKYAKTDQQKLAIQSVSDCYAKYTEVTLKEWKEVRNDASAAAYAADAADAAADAAAYAAASAYVDAYAADAADAAADAADASAAAYAADAADAAADAAAYAYAADAADAAADAADAAVCYRMKTRTDQADKLLELLRECKR